MKHTTDKSTPALSTLNRFQMEALEAATHAAFVSICQAVDPEGVADLGGHFDPPMGNAAVNAVKEAIASAILEAEEVRAKQEEANAAIVDAAKAISDAIMSPMATDAETFEEVYALAAKFIRQECKDIQDEDFSRLIGGSIVDFGKTLQGVEPNRPFDA